MVGDGFGLTWRAMEDREDGEMEISERRQQLWEGRNRECEKGIIIWCSIDAMGALGGCRGLSLHDY